MKIRDGFVSNSSSTSFYITNKTNEEKSLLDFAIETMNRVVNDWNTDYAWGSDSKISNEDFLKSAKTRKIVFPPKSRKTYSFGDSDNDIVGRVFDYCLRNGGDTDSFTWKFHESRR